MTEFERMSDLDLLKELCSLQEKKIERLSKLNKLLERKNAILNELLVLERKERQENDRL